MGSSRLVGKDELFQELEKKQRQQAELEKLIQRLEKQRKKLSATKMEVCVLCVCVHVCVHMCMCVHVCVWCTCVCVVCMCVCVCVCVCVWCVHLACHQLFCSELKNNEAG